MIEIKRIDKDTWRKHFSEYAHRICFDEVKDSSKERIDFALMGFKDGEPAGYATCLELDSETIYMQFGGAFPNIKNSIYSMKIYQMFINQLKSKYNFIGTLIENKNFAMLKFAQKAGLLITGVRYFNNNILLEHRWQR